jgi:lipopolysaccharide transport system permease protein
MRQRLWMIWQLARRDLFARLRGSRLGLAWLLITPLAFLGAYVFVFIYVLKARWPGVAAESGTAGSALAIYAGLIVHGLVAEAMIRAPGLIREQPHLVTKVVFPLHWLPVSALASALIQTALNLVVLTAAAVLSRGAFDPRMLLAPLTLLPLAVGVLALIWFLAALGVFVRDSAQAVGPLATLLLFFSPVFWPPEALPENIRAVFSANPLTLPMQWIRSAVLGLGDIDWLTWSAYLAIAVLCALAALGFFRRLSPGFANEL